VDLGVDTKEKLKQLAASVSTREGVVLYDLEMSGARVLRVFIDRSDRPVSVDDCANVSRALNLLLDVDDLVPGGAYELEVSSPGLERKLSERWHFEGAMGKTVRIKVIEAKKWVQGSTELGAAQMTLQGILAETNENDFEIRDGDNVCRIAWSEMVRAQLVFRPETNGKKR
jgi:ribosome maturation factor RimP